ncbi:MAG: hypothetical protein QNJ63_06840 [Calothrix sp. MO_192.B10]|nr:hypothetical protein [Calothrix sp. MO_192.B10]
MGILTPTQNGQPLSSNPENLPASSAVYWFSGIYLGGKIAPVHHTSNLVISGKGRFFRRLADFSSFLPNP